MSLIDDLMDRWEEQREQGVVLTPEELCADYPELLENVRYQIEALQAFESGFGLDATGKSKSSITAEALLKPPDNISISSRYLLEGCHAIGGLGQVYTAFDEVLGRRVAIKFPRMQDMSAEKVRRFELEARITGQLDHPGIVPIHALDTSNQGEPCYVMRFVDGETLQKAVSDHRSPHASSPQTSAWTIGNMRHWLQSFIAVCNIVAYAHGRGIIHRDIKPSNIVLGPFGETILLDWGIAKQLNQPTANAHRPDEMNPEPKSTKWDELQDRGSLATTLQQLTAPGSVPGTPAYASPEQLTGDMDRIGTPSDIYSLGATLFFILAGRAPLELAGWSTYLDHLRAPKESLARYLPSHIPAPLRAICSRALEVEPDKRYASPLELATDVDRFLAGEPVRVYRDPWWSRLNRWARKHPQWTGAIVASTVVVAGAAAITSGLVNAKNQELATSNTQLESALNNAESINKLAIRALGEMTSGNVTQRLAEQSELSPTDRDYIQGILAHYTALASLQPNSETSASLRAEAQLMVGDLHFQLSQREESRKHLSLAAEQFQSLTDQFDRHEYRMKHALVCEKIAAIDFEASRFDDCQSIALKGLHSINQLDATSKENTDDAILACSLNLKLMRAESLHYLDQDQEALAEFQAAVPLIEERLRANPNDVRIISNAGNRFRSFASFLIDQANGKQHTTLALQFADQAVLLLDQSVQLAPDVRGYASSLAWAYYDRADVFQEREELPQAVDDLDRCFEITRSLAERYPLIQDYRDRMIVCLARRARLHQKLNATESLDRDSAETVALLRKHLTNTTPSLLTARSLTNWMVEMAEIRYALNDHATTKGLIEETKQYMAQHMSEDSDALQTLTQRLEKLEANMQEAGPDTSK